jgi:death-on-curing protein
VTRKSKSEPAWISARAVLAIHELLLAAHGGAPGLPQAHLLESALANPKNHFSYGETDVFGLAAVYAHSLTQNHPFVDGNKRVAFTVAVTFLERHGFRLAAPENEAVQAMLDLSSGKLKASGFADWLRDNSRSTRRARRRSPKKAPRIRVIRKRK